jgi:hypothetical protein
MLDGTSGNVQCITMEVNLPNKPQNLNLMNVLHPLQPVIDIKPQAYHIKEMASFSKDSLSAAASISGPVSPALSPTRQHASMEQPQIKPPDTAAVEKKAIFDSGPLESASAKRLPHKPSRVTITSKHPTQSNPDTSKFDHIFGWTVLPVAPRMLQHQKIQISQQAAAAFRAFDIDRNSKLSSVEFFEGMTSAGLSRDQVLHLMNIHKPKQPGFYHIEEFEDIFAALYPPEEVLSQAQSNLEPIEGDEDICIILDSPISDRNHPNPSPLTQKNAGVCSA